MFEIGDLVTVDSETLRGYVHENVYNQWSTNKMGIIVDVEGYFEEEIATTILVKVHFESLGNSYWLYAREVILLTP